MAALGGPVVVKPRVSRGGRGVIVIDGTAEVDWQRLPDGQIVQEFIPGTSTGPWCSAPRAQQRRAVRRRRGKTELAQGKRRERRDTRRAEAGEAIDVGNVAMAAVRALGLTGPVDVDVRRRADGTPVVLEVNARFGANSGQAPELLDAVLASFALPSFNPASFRQSTGAYTNVLV